MTESAHLASSRTSPFPEEGSMMSTRWPAPFSRSANQRPIFPYPPTMAMWRIRAAVLGREACISMDSCMRILQTCSAYTGFIPFSRANPLYLSMTLFSWGMFLTAAFLETLSSPTSLASSSLLLMRDRI